MALATPGEETATTAAIPLVRGMGMAFGAAIAGATAASAGLRAALTPDDVARALAAVYTLALLAPVGMVVLGARLARMSVPTTATSRTAAPAPDN